MVASSSFVGRMLLSELQIQGSQVVNSCSQNFAVQKENLSGLQSPSGTRVQISADVSRAQS